VEVMLFDLVASWVTPRGSSSNRILGRSHCVNDPSAGSPTETLLRLLLPLSDKVYITSRIEFKPRRSPEGSPDHSIGRSDGRCVQRAGTYSAQADDLCLQGIPRSRSIITKIYPQHDTS
jgi:hypothetical protein